MTPADAHDRRLTALHAPRRNRYFSGKLLTAADLHAEQDYLRGADAQLARLVLGAGVVCGLEVTAVHDGDRPGIHVSAGLALDGWGRRIVVPRGAEVSMPAQPPPTMVARLYFEAREADFAPSPVGDDEGGAEAGTWVEGYRVELRPGPAPTSTADCREDTLHLIREGRFAEALAALTRAVDGAPVSDPGVTLATITASADGSLTVDACTTRAVVPTNVVLVALIAALAVRVEECCAMHAER